MAGTDYHTLIFALIVLVGGVIGYVKAGSAMSLVMGIIFGGLLGFGASQTSKNPKNIWVVLVSSLILAIVMGMRFYKSKKMMPAGMVFLFSAYTIARQLYIYYRT